MSRDSGFKFQIFYFSPDSVSNVRRSYQIWGKLAQEQKVTGKNKLGGGNPSVLIGLTAVPCLVYSGGGSFVLV